MEAPRFGNRASDRAVLATIRQSAFAPRPRAVLEAMLGVASVALETGLAATFNEFDQHLFKLAEQARGGEAQNRCFETLRESRRSRDDVAPRFMLRLESALARIGQSEQAPSFARQRRRKQDQLSLVDSEDLELALTLQEIAGKAEVRHGQVLFALGQRFGVLAGAPAIEADELPLGPHWLCECLRHASAGVALDREHRVVLFRMFERHCLSNVGSLYDQLNELCVRQRVLPHLHFLGRIRKSESVASAAAYLHGGAQAERESPATGLAAPHAPPRARAPGPIDPATVAPIGLGLGTLEVARDAERGVVRPPPPEPAPADRSSAAARREAAAAAADAQALDFEALRQQLARRRKALGVTDPHSAGESHAVRTADVQEVLGAIQNKPMPPMLVGGKLLPRSVAHLKQDVLNQLRQLTPAGQLPRLSERDSDTIDLVGMLFEQLVRDNRPGGTAQELMTRLQIPLLRVALKDKSVFSRRMHPARQLLNAVAEAAVYWVDEQGEDRSAVDKLRLMVDRVTHEYEDRPGWFEELLADLSKHLAMLTRKSDVAERRHVDAAKGRERLELARRAAAQAIATRLQEGKPSGVIRTLLELAWTDVLAITILRQGEESEPYARRLAVADRLAHQTRFASTLGDRDEADALRQELEVGLTQVGYHPEDVAMILNRLFESPPDAEADPVSLTELALKLKARARLGADAEPDGGAAAKGGPALSAQERAHLELLKALPFGTWFEFGDAQHGERARRKLSWFSPATGRCLVVNQRGAKSEESTLEDLARELAHGRARRVETHRDSAVDRAWNGVVAELRPYATAPGSDHGEPASGAGESPP